MNNGVNFGNGTFMSTADLGGQRVLGMSGSLTNYINTGVATPIDTYQSALNRKKAQNKSKIIDTLKLGVVALALASGCAIFIKKGDIQKFAKSASGYANKALEELRKPKKIDFTNFKSQMGEFGSSLRNLFKKNVSEPLKAHSATRKPLFNFENLKIKFKKADKPARKPLFNAVGFKGKINKSEKTVKKPLFNVEGLKAKFKKTKKTSTKTPLKSKISSFFSKFKKKADANATVVAQTPKAKPVSEAPKVKPIIDVEKVEPVVVEAPKAKVTVEAPNAKATTKASKVKSKQPKKVKNQPKVKNSKAKPIKETAPKVSTPSSEPIILEAPKVEPIKAEVPKVETVVEVVEPSKPLALPSPEDKIAGFLEAPISEVAPKAPPYSAQAKIDFRSYNPLGKQMPHDIKRKF